MLVVAVLIFAAVCCAHAQSTMGSILGTVQDASGAVIPGATVTVKSLDQDLTRTATTNDSGDFLVENLKAGHYSITVEHIGFAKSVVADAQLDARQSLRVPVTMAIAQQSTEVVVQATGNQINTEDATLSDSKDNIQITQLPLNDRATTTSPLGSLDVSSNVQQDSSGNIALGGATSSMVNFSVDGISTSNVRQNGALQDAYPSLEGIAAVKVTSFNNSAEFSHCGRRDVHNQGRSSVQKSSVLAFAAALLLSLISPGRDRCHLLREACLL